MNKGFQFYLKKSKNLGNFVLGKKNFSTKCFLAFYYFVSLIGKLFVLTRPIFAVADMNLNTMMDKAHNFSLTKVFEGVGDKNRYFKLLISYVVVDLISFAAFALIALPTIVIAALRGFPTVVDYIIPGVLTVVALVIIVVINLRYMPMSYVAAKTNDLETSDILYNSERGMKGNTGTGFLICLVYNLIIYLPVAVIGYFALFFAANYKTSPIGMVICFVLTLGLIALYFFVLTSVIAHKHLAGYFLCEDVVSLKKTVTVVPIAGSDEKYGPLFASNEDEKIVTELTKEDE